jgi:hypothetical protein
MLTYSDHFNIYFSRYSRPCFLPLFPLPLGDLSIFVGHVDTKVKRESGHEAQLGNIQAAKVGVISLSLMSFVSISRFRSVFL